MDSKFKFFAQIWKRGVYRLAMPNSDNRPALFGSDFDVLYSAKCFSSRSISTATGTARNVNYAAATTHHTPSCAVLCGFRGRRRRHQSPGIDRKWIKHKWHIDTHMRARAQLWWRLSTTVAVRASADSLISLSAGSPSKKTTSPHSGCDPTAPRFGDIIIRQAGSRRQPDPPGVWKSVCPWTLMAKIGISNRSSFVSGAVSGGFVCLKSDFCTTNKKKEPKSKNLIPSSGRGTIGAREFGTETEVLFYLLCCAGVPLMRFSMEMSLLTGRRRSHIFDGRLNRFTTKVAHGIVIFGKPIGGGICITERA